MAVLNNYTGGSEMDPTGWLGGLVSGVGNLIDYGRQNEQQQYDRNLQQQIFAREDNAVQRRAADMEAAGLSKTLAAGGGANAGAAIHTTAPQGLGGVVSNALGAQSLENSILQQKAQIDQTKAQTALINSNKLKVDQERNFNEQQNPQRIEELAIKNFRAQFAKQLDQENLTAAQKQNAMRQLDYDIKKFGKDFFESWGLPATAGFPGVTGQALYAGTMIDSEKAKLVPNALKMQGLVENYINSLSANKTQAEREAKETREQTNETKTYKRK